MKQKTFRFFLDLMLLVCLALAGCGLQAYAQAQLSVSLLITPAFLLLAGGAFELGRLLHTQPAAPKARPALRVAKPAPAPHTPYVALNRPVRPGPLRGLGLFRRTPRQTC